MVVSTLESAPLREAEFFMDALRGEAFHLGAVVLNKVLPSYLLDTSAADVAADLGTDPGAALARMPDDVVDSLLADTGATRDDLTRILGEIAASFLDYRVVASRESEQRAELATQPDVVATVPYFDSDIHDLAGLLRLGEQIWR